VVVVVVVVVAVVVGSCLATGNWQVTKKAAQVLSGLQPAVASAEALSEPGGALWHFTNTQSNTKCQVPYTDLGKTAAHSPFVQSM
jgi:hypothetical protein